MTNLKILLVSQGFYPENSPRSFRATELAKELARKGHEVTVLTNPKEIDLTSFSEKFGFKVKYTKKVNLREFNLNRTSGFLFFINRIIVRFLLLFFELPYSKLVFAFSRAIKNEREKYNLLISFAVPYPTHWAVALTHKKENWIAEKWIADCGDPYFLEKIDSFKKPIYFKWIEKWMFRKVDAIAITRIDFKVNYFQEFHNKIIEIPQGFDFSNLQRLKDHYQPNNIPCFAYAGRFGGKNRDPRTLFYCLESLSLDYKCILFTDQSAGLKQLLPAKLNNKVILRDFLPRDELLMELSKMDFLINIEFDPISQSPSKLIDYALTGRPILNINKKTIDRDILVLKEFLSANYRNAFEVPDIEKYNIKLVAQSFLSLAGFN